MKNPDCYKCKYRGELPGDCHSHCQHPKVSIKGGHPIDALIGMLNGEGLMRSLQALNIRINKHGFEHGWAFWPANFDPVWITNCDGFTLNTDYNDT
jgi:hypothetical protein